MAYKPKTKVYGKDIDKMEDADVKRWLRRAAAMAERRSYFETMWKNAIHSFIRHAIYDDNIRDSSVNRTLEAQQYANAYSKFRFTDTKYPLEFAVIIRKLASEFKNLPTPKWVVSGDSDQSPAILWDQVYTSIMSEEAEYDTEMFEAFLSKNIFGTAVLWSRMISSKIENKVPEIKSDGKISYKSETSNCYEFNASNHDLRHVLLDDGCTKTSLKDCEDCIVFEYITEDNLVQSFPDFDYKALNCVAVPKNQLFQDLNDLNGGNNKPLFEVAHCYNWRLDEYFIMINGKAYRKSPIPCELVRGKKRLPIALVVDHKIPGQPYGYGEPAIIKTFREIKDKNRNIIHDVTKKVSNPTMVIDPLSTFDEENYVWGQDFLRVSPNEFSYVPINANLQPVTDMDNRTDDDVMITTGINLRDTAANSTDETATRTVTRKESQLQIVDLGLNYNAVTGLKRYHANNASILLLYLKSPSFNNGKQREVLTSGKKIFKTQNPENQKDIGKYTVEDKAGEHLYSYVGEELNYSFMPTLVIGNIAISDQLEKNIIVELVTTLVKLFPDTINSQVAAETIIKLYRKVPKDIINQPDKQLGGLKPVPDEESAITDLISKSGGMIPEQAQIANNYKNAQLAQAQGQAVPGTEALGAGPNGNG